MTRNVVPAASLGAAILLAAFALALAFVLLLADAAPASAQGRTTVCDPRSSTNCAAVDANGNLHVTGNNLQVNNQAYQGRAATPAYAPIQEGSDGALLTSDGYPEASRVACTGATYNPSTGAITYSAVSQSCVIDTQGYGGFSFYMGAGSGLTLGVYSTDIAGTSGGSPTEFWPANPASTVGVVPITSVIPTGQYSGNPSGRFLILLDTAFTSNNTVTISLRAARFPPRVNGQTVNVTGYVGYADSNTALGASATFTGTARTPPTSMRTFKCRAYSDQAGTLNLQESDDGGATYQTVATAAIAAAGVSANVKIDLTGVSGTTLTRCNVANGSTPEGTLRLTSAFGTQ